MWTQSILVICSFFHSDGAQVPSQPLLALGGATEVQPASNPAAPVRWGNNIRQGALSQPGTPKQLPASSVSKPGSADDIIGKVQAFYDKTNSFKATFHQTVKNKTFSLKAKVSTGRVYILKPGKMRFDYKNETRRSAKDPKLSKSFISDGKHLWAVMHKNKQYYKQDLEGSALPVAVSFLMGSGDLRKEFTVELQKSGTYGSKEDLLLLLTPKKPSARYKKLWLVVDSQKFSVKQSVVINAKNDSNSIRFSKVVIDDGSLRKGHFIFNEKANKDYRLTQPPKGA